MTITAIILGVPIFRIFTVCAICNAELIEGPKLLETRMVVEPAVCFSDLSACEEVINPLERSLTNQQTFFQVSRGSNGYARIDVRFPDKNDKLVQTRYMTRVRESACLGFDSKWLLF